MAHVHPLDPAANAQRIRDAIERVAWDAVAAFDAGLFQSFDDDLTNALLAHGAPV